MSRQSLVPSRAQKLVYLAGKDHVVMRFFWLFYPLMYLVALPLLSRSIDTAITLEYLVAFWVIGVLSIDLRAKPDRFVCSLPVSRTDVVLGRYLWALSIFAVGLLLILASGYLQFRISGERIRDWVYLAGGMGVLYLMIPMSVPVFLALPVSYWFGQVPAMVVGYGSAVLYLPFFIGVERTLERLNSDLIRVLRVLDRQVGPGGYNVFLLQQTADRHGAALIVLPIVGILAALAALSIWISVAGYRRREFS
jgi:hypothetical protein